MFSSHTSEALQTIDPVLFAKLQLLDKQKEESLRNLTNKTHIPVESPISSPGSSTPDYTENNRVRKDFAESDGDEMIQDYTNSNSRLHETVRRDYNNRDKDSYTDFTGEHQNITLYRANTGLGFCIGGGTDKPHDDDDTSIYITKIIDGGAAANDGRLEVDDVITHVNDVCMVDVPHETAVNALKTAGNKVVLKVKRKTQKEEVDVELIEVELIKGSKGLGFTIGGGIGNQHVPGDNGIYITKVLEGGAAAQDGRLAVGDRIVAVRNPPNGDIFLENCTHKEAVQTLAGQQRVVLIISKGDTYCPTARSASPVIQQPIVNVVLNKGPAGFGFNIIGGEDGSGIFISFILAGGPADASGHVRRGDQILSVNGVDLSSATHTLATKALKAAGNTLQMQLQFKPDEYHQYEEKLHTQRKQMISGSNLSLSDKKSFYVRALFDFDPSKDTGIPSRGLMFRFGDVLHITNASDEDWWQARKVFSQGDGDELGLVPSRSRWEKKARTRDRSVRWTEKKKQGSLGRKLPFKKSREDNHDDSFNSNDEECIPTYQMVQQVQIGYIRPVIILGPLKDEINVDLITKYPNAFELCVQHTTRPRREYEVDGQDYHFVDDKGVMEEEIKKHWFIGVGQFNDNLYGTSISSIEAVASQGKHCLLDVSGKAIKQLHAARMYPIAVFVKPRDYEYMMNNKKMTPEQAKKMLDKASKVENEFVEYFTAVVEGDSMDYIQRQVKQVIEKYNTTNIWVSSNESF